MYDYSTGAAIAGKNNKTSHKEIQKLEKIEGHKPIGRFSQRET
jgi:hypothetical protein